MVVLVVSYRLTWHVGASPSFVTRHFWNSCKISPFLNDWDFMVSFLPKGIRNEKQEGILWFHGKRSIVLFSRMSFSQCIKFLLGQFNGVKHTTQPPSPAELYSSIFHLLGWISNYYMPQDTRVGFVTFSWVLSLSLSRCHLLPDSGEKLCPWLNCDEEKAHLYFSVLLGTIFIPLSVHNPSSSCKCFLIKSRNENVEARKGKCSCLYRILLFIHNWNFLSRYREMCKRGRKFIQTTFTHLLHIHIPIPLSWQNSVGWCCVDKFYFLRSSLFQLSLILLIFYSMLISPV